MRRTRLDPETRKVIRETLQPARISMQAFASVMRASDRTTDDAALGRDVRRIVRRHAARQIAWTTRPKAEETRPTA